MKFNVLFISAGICCAVFIGCNQPQKQESTTTNNDDVVWKAEFSYCINSEQFDWQSIKEGYPTLTTAIYNFKLKEEKGTYRDIMKIMYDSSLSNTCPLYALNPANALAPEVQLTNRERHDYFDWTDSVKNSAGNMEAKEHKLSFNDLKGMAITHELMFDADAGAIKSTVTDECIQTYVVSKNGDPIPENTPLVNLAGIRFANRTSDSLYLQSAAAQPGMVWAEDILFSFVDSTDEIHMPEFHSGHDSTLSYTVDGVTSNCSYLYPVRIKSTYDKSLGEWLRIAAMNGKAKAYQPADEGKMGDLILAKDVKHIGEKTESYTYDGKTSTYTIKVSGDDIAGIEFKEELAFHEKTFCFESKITYAGILVTVKDANGRVIPRTSKVLFWVKLN